MKGNTAGGNTGDGLAFIDRAGKVSGNTADANSGTGFAIAVTSSLTKLIGNTANASGLLRITVSGLSNHWKGNTFGTKSQSCIK